jgi:hypothetical protein
MSKTKKQKKYGMFYMSNGRWNSTPYLTFTKYMMNREPWKSDINFFKNYVLKSRIKVLQVS